MTIEEMKNALKNGRSAESILRNFENMLKQAQHEVRAENAKIKAERLENARLKLASAIASYDRVLFGSNSNMSIPDVVAILKSFEEDANETINSFDNILSHLEGTKFNCNNKAPAKEKNDLDDELLDDFLKLFNLQ